MRAAILAATLVMGCQDSPRSSAQGRAVEAVTSASHGSDQEITEECRMIRTKWDRDVRRFAGQPQRCERDDDCDCFGGPTCPNAVVSVCPGPVRADVAAVLVPHMEAWMGKGCPVIWSPHLCEPGCRDGRCVSVR